MDKYILSVEIGGTKLQLGLGRPSGEILLTRRAQVDIEAGGEGIRGWLETNIPAFRIDAADNFGEIAAIGCGFGGPVNAQKGRILRSVQIHGWQDFPLRDWFIDKFSLPTVVENDSNAAAWGEYKLGFGQGSQTFFYTNLGSGVGGGFVFDGKLFNGQGYGAGEFGHTFVPDWTVSEAGRAKKIENLCSGWAIENRLRTPGYIPETSTLFRQFSHDLTAITAQNLAEAAASGDSFAQGEINRVAHSIGIGLANVLCLTGIERIAIGGGIAKMGEILIEPIRRYTRKYEFVINKDNYRIGQCQLGDSIVLTGATLLASEQFNIT